ncbi:MAG: acyltransferase [Chloroflexi bacterium]|nr:MAG: acyltransferase [Chloroflexota bacterium]MBL1193193.1 acyltransferase [Chloroflexota bacterium]NOH10487.1 acyltransferase [Chloroflexota bacterium]
MAESEQRVVLATHGRQSIEPDSEFEVGLSDHLCEQHSPEELKAQYARFQYGDDGFNSLMRRVIWRAMAKSFGNGVQIGSGAQFKHIETFEIGDGVFIGAQANIQGRYDGYCVIGAHSWIGPQSYLDARDLVIGEYVGWGPGAKVLGSEHSGLPLDVPIIQTDLEIKPVHVKAEADIGVNAVLLPGVTIGKGAIVGAGAVVTEDVADYAVAAGVPAKFLKWREGYEPQD